LDTYCFCCPESRRSISRHLLLPYCTGSPGFLTAFGTSLVAWLPLIDYALRVDAAGRLYPIATDRQSATFCTVLATALRNGASSFLSFDGTDSFDCFFAYSPSTFSEATDLDPLRHYPSTTTRTTLPPHLLHKQGSDSDNDNYASTGDRREQNEPKYLYSTFPRFCISSSAIKLKSKRKSLFGRTIITLLIHT